MRVIGGTAKGMRLRTIRVPHLRPMLDRVKEALFNIIRSDLQGTDVLDLFSGCGGLGIEALSRGATSCVFVEFDPALVGVLSENVRKCGLCDRAHIVRADVLSLGERGRPCAAPPAGLVFADPPYALVEDPNRRGELFRTLEALLGSWIAPGALVVLHHAPMPHALWPTTRMRRVDQRIYGRSQISLLEVLEEPDDERR